MEDGRAPAAVLTLPVCGVKEKKKMKVCDHSQDYRQRPDSVHWIYNTVTLQRQQNKDWGEKRSLTLGRLSLLGAAQRPPGRQRLISFSASPHSP